MYLRVHFFMTGPVAQSKARSGDTTGAASALRGGGGTECTSESGIPTSIPDVTVEQYTTVLTQGAKWSLVPKDGGGQPLPIRFKARDPSDPRESNFPGVYQVDVSGTYSDDIFNPIEMVIEGEPDETIQYKFEYEWLPLEKITNPTVKATAEKIYAHFKADIVGVHGFIVLTDPQFKKLLAARGFLHLVQTQNGGYQDGYKWGVRDQPGNRENYGIYPGWIEHNTLFEYDYFRGMLFQGNYHHNKKPKHSPPDEKGESNKTPEILPGSSLGPCTYIMTDSWKPLFPLVNERLTTIVHITIGMEAKDSTILYFPPEEECPICYNKIRAEDPVLIPTCWHAKYCANCVKAMTKDGVFTCALCKDTCREHEIIRSECKDP